MNNSHNIILIGITGVGKSTIARLLASRLKKTFIDLDKNIETRCGVDIQTIFAIEGEQGFRERETAELARTINNSDNYVLSLGGGTVIKPENVQLITASQSFVIQLHASIDALVARLTLSASRRPLFNGNDVATKLTELINARREFYDNVTNFKIDTSNMQPTQVVTKIVNYLGNSLG